MHGNTEKIYQYLNKFWSNQKASLIIKPAGLRVTSLYYKLSQTLTLVTKRFQGLPCFIYETAPDKLFVCGVVKYLLQMYN